MKMRFQNAVFCHLGRYAAPERTIAAKVPRSSFRGRRVEPEVRRRASTSMARAVLRARGFSDAEIAALARESVLVQKRRG